MGLCVSTGVAVGVVDFDGSGGEGGVGVAALALDVRAAGGSDGGHGVGEVGADVGLVGVVLDAHGGRSGVGLGEGFGDGDSDVLAPVADGVVGERRAVLAGASAAGGVAVDAADVAVMQDEEDAGKFFRGRRCRWSGFCRWRWWSRRERRRPCAGSCSRRRRGRCRWS